MTNFLIRLFIGKNTDPKNENARGRYASLACFTGIFTNVFLFIGKLILGILSASVAMIADAFNNITDAGSSIVNLIGFKLSEKPVDKEHPLGHGRLEYVSGFIVNILILLVGFELFKSSLEKIITPALPNVGNVTLILLFVAILVKLWLYFFYSKIAKTIQSASIKAAAIDSLTDCIATTLVLASALIARFYSIAIDGWAGILVAAFILYAGIRAAKETIDLLLGSPPDPQFIEDIYAFAKNYTYVVGIHDVMVHDYGPGRQIVSFHAEVPADSDINLAHEEVDALERDMHKKFGCIVTVHLDPIVVNDPLVNELRALAVAAAKRVDESFSIHDFRITKGETNVNLIFDLLVPTDCKIPTDEAAKAVSDEIRKEKPNCFCVIKAEHPYV